MNGSEITITLSTVLVKDSFKWRRSYEGQIVTKVGIVKGAIPLFRDSLFTQGQSAGRL